MLEIVASYHCMQFQDKLMNQTRKYGKKPSFGADFGLKFFFVGFASTRYYTLLQAIIVCNFKEN